MQATDRDLPPNNEITYSIISGDTQANFTINSTTGYMTLAGPINYEAMAPELAGKFTMIVMAKDHGIPPLSSTVTVIVYVQVRLKANFTSEKCMHDTWVCSFKIYSFHLHSACLIYSLSCLHVAVCFHWCISWVFVAGCHHIMYSSYRHLVVPPCVIMGMSTSVPPFHLYNQYVL